MASSKEKIFSPLTPSSEKQEPTLFQTKWKLSPQKTPPPYYQKIQNLNHNQKQKLLIQNLYQNLKLQLLIQNLCQNLK